MGKVVQVSGRRKLDGEILKVSNWADALKPWELSGARDESDYRWVMLDILKCLLKVSPKVPAKAPKGGANFR